MLNLGLEASEETKVCMVCDEGTDEIVSGKVDQVEEIIEETEAMEGDWRVGRVTEKVGVGEASAAEVSDRRFAIRRGRGGGGSSSSSELSVTSVSIAEVRSLFLRLNSGPLADVEFGNVIEDIHALQTYNGIFFFAMVHLVWKKLKHLVHWMGLVPLRNLTRHEPQLVGIVPGLDWVLYRFKAS